MRAVEKKQPLPSRAEGKANALVSMARYLALVLPLTLAIPTLLTRGAAS